MIKRKDKLFKIYQLGIEFYPSFDLTNYNTMKLKSKCHVLVKPKSIEELKEVLNIAKEYNEKYFILGNGSNTILPEYYSGICIKLDNFNKMKFDEGSIEVECGYMLNKLAIELSNKGYTGLEWATHIPGTIGGSIYSNAGAYTSSISDLIKTITILEDNEIKVLTKEEAKFGYRTSIFKENKNLVILSCAMEVKKGDLPEIKTLIKERTEKRIATQPLNYPSCGSVFRNPTNAAAGKLIEDAGLKNTKVGGCEVSNKHANFIINVGEATKADYDKLVKIIKDKVKEIYGIDLILEQEVIE